LTGRLQGGERADKKAGGEMIAGLFPLCLVMMTTTTVGQVGIVNKTYGAPHLPCVQSRVCQASTATDASASHFDDAHGALLYHLSSTLPTLYIHAYMPVSFCYTRCPCRFL
jgi:hypothetical protein